MWSNRGRKIGPARGGVLSNERVLMQHPFAESSGEIEYIRATTEECEGRPCTLLKNSSPVLHTDVPINTDKIVGLD